MDCAHRDKTVSIVGFQVPGLAPPRCRWTWWRRGPSRTSIAARNPQPAKNGRVVPEAFRLGSYPRDVYNRLDGQNTLRQLVARHTNASDRVAFLRTLYLLHQTELAFWV